MSGEGASAAARYSRWGIPQIEAEAALADGPISAERFNTLMGRLPLLPEGGRYRVSPASFGGGAALHAFPRSSEWRWDSLESFLRSVSSQGLIHMLPIFWQTEPAAFFAARAAQAPLFANQPDNFAVGARAVDSAGLDTVVVEADRVVAFRSYLADNRDPYPKHWIVVHGAAAAPVDPHAFPNDCLVTQEYHLIPGVPVFVQCLAQARARENLFHVTDEFEFSFLRKAMSIKDEKRMPLFEVALPRSVAEKGECLHCRKTLYALC